MPAAEKMISDRRLGFAKPGNSRTFNLKVVASKRCREERK
jgi:hypothetical protein